jgi:parallel beta-helix repeat protein
VYNNIVYGNARSGIKVDYGAVDARIFNNTVYRNGREGIYIGQGSTSADVINNIAYGNPYNLFNSGQGTTLNRNLTTDPRFVDAGSFNFRLRPGSPAIDAGAKIDIVSTDFDGSRRPIGGSHDIGAFEGTD